MHSAVNENAPKREKRADETPPMTPPAQIRMKPPNAPPPLQMTRTGQVHRLRHSFVYREGSLITTGLPAHRRLPLSNVSPAIRVSLFEYDDDEHQADGTSVADDDDSMEDEECLTNSPISDWEMSMCLDHELSCFYRDDFNNSSNW